MSDETVVEQVDQTGQLTRSALLRRAAAAGFSALAAEQLLAGGAMAATSPKAGGTLYVAGPDAGNMDPALWNSGSLVGPTIYEGLQSYVPDEPGKVVNSLAQEFTVSKDGKRISFTLKRGQQFHHGFGELTAEDVKFSFERVAGLTTPKVNSIYAGDWAPLQRVQVTGKYTGVIHLKEPFAPLLHSTIPDRGGWITSKKAIEKLGNKYSASPVGTGPYYVDSNGSDKTVMRRFEQYGGANASYNKPAAWNRIIIYDFSTGDPTALTSALAALKSGDINVIPVSDPTLLKGLDTSKYKRFTAPTTAYAFLALNVQHPKLRDIRVRKAIRAAVDVPGYIQVQTGGSAIRARAIIPQTMGLGYWADAPLYKRDVGQAKQLLSQAGVSNLSLDMPVMPLIQSNDAAAFLQANLAEVGINLNLLPMDQPTYVKYANTSPDAQVVPTSYSATADPYGSFEWFNCKNEWSRARTCYGAYDRLLAASTVETDPEKRGAMFVKMQQIMDQSAGYVWLFFPTVTFVAPTNLRLRYAGPAHLNLSGIERA